jgi:hypothetical protein
MIHTTPLSRASCGWCTFSARFLERTPDVIACSKSCFFVPSRFLKRQLFAIAVGWLLTIATFIFFILGCGGAHFVEAVTVWIPGYVLSAAVEVFTAAVSLTTAAVLPFTVPDVFSYLPGKNN